MPELPDDASPDDLRADLESAFTEVEEPSTPDTPAASPTEPTGVEAPPVPIGETEEARAERIRDDKGRFAKGTPAAAAPVSVVPPVSPPPPARPPQSWRPDVRERFAALPPDVQAEVVRREREVDIALKESAGARKAIDELQAMVRPHLGTLQAEGTSPAQAFQNFLGVASTMRQGTPEVKAQILANWIKHYGVDIEKLAAALDGTPMPQGGQQVPMRDPRVDELLARINNAEQTRLNRAFQEESQTVAGFGDTHEFFEDVRLEMADLIDVYAKRGVALSYEDAYSRAIAARPEFAKVLQQREAATATRNGVPSIARAKAASSSVRSRPVSSAPTAAPKDVDDLRGAIEQAFDEAEGR